jgi:hypothetical protein
LLESYDIKSKTRGDSSLLENKYDMDMPWTSKRGNREKRIFAKFSTYSAPATPDRMQSQTTTNVSDNSDI